QAEPVDDAQIQHRLIDIWQAKSHDAALAELSLRCFISHQILMTCTGIVQRFGQAHSLDLDEMLALVLDDIGQTRSASAPSYRSLALEILISYNPTKAKLNTWTARLVKNQPDVNRYLLDRGLYRISSWAILNDTSCDQLRRILTDYFGCTTGVESACDLLSQYHRVYRQERQRSRPSRKLCLPPTESQLYRIAPASPKDTLERLTGLASQLRQYRIHVRRGIPFTVRAADVGSGIELENLADPQNTNLVEWEPDAQAFLRTYRESLDEYLAQAIASCIQARVTQLKRRQPASVEAYLQALRLFHGEGLSMGKIAARIGRQNQVQVTRLLQLTQLRASVQDRLLPRLQKRVQTHCLRYVSVEHLERISTSLNQLVAEEVGNLLQASAAATQSDRRCQNLFSQHVCEALARVQTENVALKPCSK
ncbi:MAG: hypothetical protein WBG38_07295, partial [Nodosilinea sp.]